MLLGHLTSNKQQPLHHPFAARGLPLYTWPPHNHSRQRVEEQWSESCVWTEHCWCRVSGGRWGAGCRLETRPSWVYPSTSMLHRLPLQHRKHDILGLSVISRATLTLSATHKKWHLRLIHYQQSNMDTLCNIEHWHLRLSHPHQCHIRSCCYTEYITTYVYPLS